MTVWDYDTGKDGGNKTGKMRRLMQLVRGMYWEASSLCSQLEFDAECPIGIKNSDPRSKCANGTVYIGYIYSDVIEQEFPIWMGAFYGYGIPCQK